MEKLKVTTSIDPIGLPHTPPAQHDDKLPINQIQDDKISNHVNKPYTNLPPSPISPQRALPVLELQSPSDLENGAISISESPGNPNVPFSTPNRWSQHLTPGSEFDTSQGVEIGGAGESREVRGVRGVLDIHTLTEALYGVHRSASTSSNEIGRLESAFVTPRAGRSFGPSPSFRPDLDELNMDEAGFTFSLAQSLSPEQTAVRLINEILGDPPVEVRARLRPLFLVEAASTADTSFTYTESSMGPLTPEIETERIQKVERDLEIRNPSMEREMSPSSEEISDDSASAHSDGYEAGLEDPDHRQRLQQQEGTSQNESDLDQSPTPAGVHGRRRFSSDRRRWDDSGHEDGMDGDDEDEVGSMDDDSVGVLMREEGDVDEYSLNGELDAEDQEEEEEAGQGPGGRGRSISRIPSRYRGSVSVPSRREVDDEPDIEGDSQVDDIIDLSNEPKHTHRKHPRNDHDDHNHESEGIQSENQYTSADEFDDIPSDFDPDKEEEPEEEPEIFRVAGKWIPTPEGGKEWRYFAEGYYEIYRWSDGYEEVEWVRYDTETSPTVVEGSGSGSALSEGMKRIKERLEREREGRIKVLNKDEVKERGVDIGKLKDKSYGASIPKKAISKNLKARDLLKSQMLVAITAKAQISSLSFNTSAHSQKDSPSRPLSYLPQPTTMGRLQIESSPQKQSAS